jgi:hypothetical protein
MSKRYSVNTGLQTYIQRLWTNFCHMNRLEKTKTIAWLVGIVSVSAILWLVAVNRLDVAVWLPDEVRNVLERIK